MSTNDWNLLSDEEAPAADIGGAVSNIVCCVRDRLALDSPTYVGDEEPSLSNIAPMNTDIFDADVLPVSDDTPVGIKREYPCESSDEDFGSKTARLK